MIEIRSKYNTAKILVEDDSKVEESARKQVYDLLNQVFIKDENIVIMPDIHSGKGCVIGYTQTLKHKRVVPNLVGVDIGCAITYCKIPKEIGDRIFNKPGLEKLDKLIRQEIPLGMKHRKDNHPFVNKVPLHQIKAKGINIEKVKPALGSLGGGNHFIEVGKDSQGDYYIQIHSGSRNLGVMICSHYQQLAITYHKNIQETQRKQKQTEIVEDCKKLGREKDIPKELQKLKEQFPSVPEHFAYLENQNFDDYLHDMKITQEFAIWNREAMLDVILKGMGIKKNEILEVVHSIHNYIDTDTMILRKGSTSLRKDEKAVIPLNMRDGSLIVVGKGNETYNSSGPHGAGRLMSRSEAKETLKMEDFKAAMKGVYTTSVSTATIDEAPGAYKPAEAIISQISELCDVIEVVKPIYNLKASD